MSETKPFYQSSTYWGLFVAFFSVLNQMLIPFNAEFPMWLQTFMENQFVDTMTMAGQFVGLLIAARGRNKATTGIRLK